MVLGMCDTFDGIPPCFTDDPASAIAIACGGVVRTT